MILWTRSVDQRSKDMLFLEPYKAKITFFPTVLQRSLDFLESDLGLENFFHHFFFITSSFCLEEIEQRNLFQKELAIASIFAFGFKTAELAKKKYPTAKIIFQDIISSAEDLGNFVLEQKFLKNSCLIYPGAKKRNFWFSVSSREDNLSIFQPILYETLTPSKAGNLPQLQKTDVVCFASPSAVLGFLELAKADFEINTLRVVAIGETTRGVCCEHFSNVIVAKEQSLEALFQKALELQ